MIVVIGYLAIFSLDYYDTLDYELIQKALIRTFIVICFCIAFAYKYPHLLKNKGYTYLIYLSFIVFIMYFIDIFFIDSDNRLTYAYLFIFIFTGFLLYDTKFILIRSQRCRGNADYIEGTLDIFLDVVNLFNNITMISND